MAKKSEEVTEKKELLLELNLEFGREDLNLLKDRLNEVIRQLNKE